MIERKPACGLRPTAAGGLPILLGAVAGRGSGIDRPGRLAGGRRPASTRVPRSSWPSLDLECPGRPWRPRRACSKQGRSPSRDRSSASGPASTVASADRGGRAVNGLSADDTRRDLVGVASTPSRRRRDPDASRPTPMHAPGARRIGGVPTDRGRRPRLGFAERDMDWTFGARSVGMTTATEDCEALGMLPHPEGGWYVGDVASARDRRSAAAGQRDPVPAGGRRALALASARRRRGLAVLGRRGARASDLAARGPGRRQPSTRSGGRRG